MHMVMQYPYPTRTFSDEDHSLLASLHPPTFPLLSESSLKEGELVRVAGEFKSNASHIISCDNMCVLCFYCIMQQFITNLSLTLTYI